MRLLFVCTGNLCRSQVAERLTVAAAARALGSSADVVVVRSAGLEAAVGRPMDRRSATALVRLGGDPAGARATPLTPGVAEDADLVLTMTRAQRTAVLEHAPRGLRRTFTLLEAADLAGAADLGDLGSLPLSTRAAALAQRLAKARAFRAVSDRDDIVDPMGQRQGVHHQVAGTIADALRPLTAALFGPPLPAPPRTTAGGVVARG